MFKKNKTEEQNKTIEIEAGMEGNIKFSTPVNLKINSRFKGTLETKGTLIIGDKADIKAKYIKGEDIAIFGRVEGDVICSGRLTLSPPAKVIGNVQAPFLIIAEGALLKGNCEMPIKPEKDTAQGNVEPRRKAGKKKTKKEIERR